jgi:hypothetical protein
MGIKRPPSPVQLPVRATTPACRLVGRRAWVRGILCAGNSVCGESCVRGIQLNHQPIGRRVGTRVPIAVSSDRTPRETGGEPAGPTVPWAGVVSYGLPIQHSPAGRRRLGRGYASVRSAKGWSARTSGPHEWAHKLGRVGQSGWASLGGPVWVGQSGWASLGGPVWVGQSGWASLGGPVVGRSPAPRRCSELDCRSQILGVHATGAPEAKLPHGPYYGRRR